MLHSKVVFYQTMREIIHLHTLCMGWNSAASVWPVCRYLSDMFHDWPHVRFSAKCALSICLGIRKSAEHNFESEKNYSSETEVGGSWSPPPLGSRGLTPTCCCFSTRSHLLSDANNYLLIRMTSRLRSTGLTSVTVCRLRQTAMLETFKKK